MKITAFKKKGFALVLVLSLAAIIVLLGASLVALNQIETASRTYKTNVRTARDNARAALEMALGDLQQYAGRDQTVTALADGFRSPADQALDEESAPEDDSGSRVYQPFWTGIWDNDSGTSDSVNWLVTRPRRTSSGFGAGGAGTLANPLFEYADSVVLVGPGTSVFPDHALDELPTAPNQAAFNVTAPLESIIGKKSINDLEEGEVDAVVGKYGYWIGDLGVKASYAVPYRVPEVIYDDYSVENELLMGTRTRLEQMVGHGHRMSGINLKVDPNRTLAPLLVSDFQLRERVPDTEKSAFLDGLTIERVRDRFQDHTTLSRGVLVNAIEGGLKRDLSIGKVTNDSLVDNVLAPYLNWSERPQLVNSALSRTVFARPRGLSIVGEEIGSVQKIAPILTEFHVRFSLFFERSTDQLELIPKLKVMYNFELWNPYTSSMASAGDSGVDWVLRIDGFPSINIRYKASNTDPDYVSSEKNFLLGDYLDTDDPLCYIDMSVPLRPGQIRLYSGASDLDIDVNSIGFDLIHLDSGLNFSDVTPVVAGDDSGLDDDFIEYQIVDEFIPSISIYQVIDGAEELLSHYSTPSGFGAFESDYWITDVAVDERDFRFGYHWEMLDPINGGIDWRLIDVRSDLLPESYYSFFQDLESADNVNPTISDASDRLLGFNHTAYIPYTVAYGYDTPRFELPRQAVVSLAEAQGTHFLNGIFDADILEDVPLHLGRSQDSIGAVASINRVFDQYFLSTVPNGDTDWGVGMALPNTRIEFQKGVLESKAKSLNSAEGIFVRGMFNVNSTSVEAWVAVLKSLDLETWNYANPADHDAPFSVAFDTSEDRSEFLFYSQSAEEVWLTEAGLSSSYVRQAYRKGVKSLSNEKVEELARQIVKVVRERISATSGPRGPFTSLKEFVDEGVLETAIADADIALGVAGKSKINNTTTNPQPGAPGYLTQGTILNCLAPFLSVRSDTFLIRAYGDSRDAYDEDKIVAKAYCEAVVQRFPQKHPSDGDKDNAMSATGIGDTEYGRLFKIVAFRWLTPEEI